MFLPIDEMLMDLREKLETFERDITGDSLDEVFREMMRMQNSCEDYLENNHG